MNEEIGLACCTYCHYFVRDIHGTWCTKWDRTGQTKTSPMGTCDDYTAEQAKLPDRKDDD